jgi:hypothetical protein
LIAGSILIAFGLICAAIVPMVAQEEPTPPPPTDGIQPAAEVVTNDTAFYSNETGATPATKR